MNSFQELRIFENSEINKLCDSVTAIIVDIIGTKPIVCGSVAKLLSGMLNEDSYHPKDIDFYILSDWDFRKVKNNFPTEIEGALMIEHRPERIIIHSNMKMCIEVWQNLHKTDNKEKGIQLKNNQIPYKNYGN